MIKPCIRCKIRREEAELKDIRGDTDLEGYIITQFPEALQINEKDAIEVCFNCEKVLRDRNNNPQALVNRSNNRSRNVDNLSTIRESEDIQIASQSLDSRIEAPLSSSIENQAAPPSFDLEILKQPGEVEKLAKDPNVKRELRKLIIKSMPAAAKKRKLSEMLGNTPNIASSQSSSNSESETVVERSPTQPLPPRQITDNDRGNELLRYYLSQSGRLNRTFVPSSQSQEVSPSQSLDASNHDLSVSSQEIIQVPLVDKPRDPVIFVRPQQPQRRKSPLAVLYERDSSSDRESDTGSGRRSSERVAVRNQSESSSSDDEQAAERRRLAERLARRASDERRAAQANAERQRQQNDGNDHSNLAAPRRINLDQPTATRHQKNSKDTNGG